jgi:hypothetical protein
LRRSGLLCAVAEYHSMKEFGLASDAWLADETGRSVTQRMPTDVRSSRSPRGLFTEVALV